MPQTPIMRIRINRKVPIEYPITKPDRTKVLNKIKGTLILLEVMVKYGVKKFVFSSSATVYGPPQRLPVDEPHQVGVGITNPYGRTKYFIEEILRDLVIADPEWKVTLLR